MSINEKIKAINKKIEQNSALFDLDRQTFLLYHEEMLVIMNYLKKTC